MYYVNCKFLLVVFITFVNTLCFSQNQETRSVSYLDDGLVFTSNLVRQNGQLVGYEMEVKNISDMVIKFEFLPVVPSEASGVTIREAGYTDGKSIDTGVVLYPMHHPTLRQKFLEKSLAPNSSVKVKGTFEELFNAYKGSGGGLNRTDLTNPSTPRAKFDATKNYEISFSPMLSFIWPDQTQSQNARRSSKITTNISFQDKLTFKDVKVVR
jgi:hypothetical protein